MDKIFTALWRSDKPERDKAYLTVLISRQGSQIHGPSEVVSMLKAASQFIVNGDSDCSVKSAQSVFIEWARCNDGAALLLNKALHSLVIPNSEEDGNADSLDFTEVLLTSPSLRRPENVCWILDAGLDIMQKNKQDILSICRIVSHHIIKFISSYSNIQVVMSVCGLCWKHRDCIPMLQSDFETTSQFCVTVIQALISSPGLQYYANQSAARNRENELKHISDVASSVGVLMEFIWNILYSSPNTSHYVRASLGEIFKTISLPPAYEADEDLQPCLVLGAVAQYLPTQLVEQAIPETVSSLNTSDEVLGMTLDRMLDWIRIPGVRNVDTWATKFIRELVNARKASIAFKIIEIRSGELFELLRDPGTRSSAFNVLQYMMFTYQHHAGPFHSIVEDIPSLIKHILEEPDSVQRETFKQAFTHLLYCLMHLHSGFPDLYEPVLEAIKDIPRPSAEEINNTISVSQLLNLKTRTGGYIHDDDDVSVRKVGQMAGLVNLSNTCYVNSVMQALYMTDRFRNECQSLQAVSRQHQPILTNLQLLFAFLSFTKRAAYAPREFVTVSRPPWFSEGTQQDCSEFFKHLLNALDDQERGIRKQNCAHRNDSNAMDIVQTSVSGAIQSTSSTGSPPRKQATGSAAAGSPAGKQATGSAATGSPAGKQATGSAAAGSPAGKQATGSAATSSPAGKQTSGSAATGSPAKKQDQPVAAASKVNQGSGLQAADLTLIERNFCGKLTYSCRCLTCKQVSTRIETFMDIALGFPVEDDSDKMSDVVMAEGPQITGGKGGLGGQASEHTNNTVTALAPNVAAASVVQNVVKLDDLLSHFLTTERLTGDNLYWCEGCGAHVEGERSVGVAQAPKHLILTLSRFSFDPRLGRRTKIMTEVKFDPILHLPISQTPGTDTSGVRLELEKSVSKSASKSSLQSKSGKIEPKIGRTDSSGQVSGSTDREGKVEYCLTGVIVHSGQSSESGHYYCYARHSVRQNNSAAGSSSARRSLQSVSDFYSDSWYLFNDSRVTESTFSRISNLTSHFSMDTPYVLIYTQVEDSGGAICLPQNQPVPLHLRQIVDEDNKKFIEEREKAERKKITESRSGFYGGRRDSRGGGGSSSGGCGGGGSSFSNMGPPAIF